MPVRSRKVVKAYKKRNAFYKNQPKEYCFFCTLTPQSEDFVSETKSFWIIKNRFPYSLWDEHEVEDHLLICPKKHTETIGSLTSSEAVELIDIISSYEIQGYNFYSRAPESKMKSIPHQHTHLLKPRGNYQKFMIYSAKPYIRITF